MRGTAGPYRFGIGFVYTSSETIAEISAEMIQYMQENYPQSNQSYLFCMVSDSGSTWLPCAGYGAEELVRESYEEYDGGEYIIFRPATTRKLKNVPPLMKVLEKSMINIDLIDEVLSVAQEIPEWRVATYGQIARLTGRDRNARTIGREKNSFNSLYC